MTIISKLTPITSSCIEYVHPWQASCTIATAGLLIQSFQYSFRTYSAVYLLSLLMRGKLPSGRDLRRTVFAIFQSTAFLTTSAFSYCVYLCIIRQYWGSLNFYTASYVPAFLSSISAILLERPSRRGMLCLYVSNVATETVYNMLVVRGLVPRPIEYGQVGIFGVSAAALLYYYRCGLHERHNDSIFAILRFVVGAGEEEIAGIVEDRPNDAAVTDGNDESPAPTAAAAAAVHQIRFGRRRGGGGSARRLPFLLNAVRAYATLIQRIKRMWRHPTCPHRSSCVYYALESGVKLFSIGLGIQISLKMLLQITRIFTKGPGHLIRQLFSRDTVQLAIFLGGFSSLYRACSCSLRHTTGRDDPRYAIPSALVASIAFFSYPDTTVALYAMWKMLQITYNYGVERGYVPNVPHFTFLLYCASTAMLFHAATWEPLTLRPNYWKFLHSLSGGRVAGMNREILEKFGLDTSKQLAEALRRTKTTNQIAFAL